MSYNVNDTQTDLKFTKKCSHFLRKSSNSKRNCGQSQKDIRLNYK